MCLVLCLLSARGVVEASEFRLPSRLKVIEREAFMGIPMNTIELPEALTRIESRAFAQTGLEYTVIPRSVTYIANDAFDGCADFSPAVYDGSYAQQWCADNGISTWKITGLGVASHTKSDIRAFVDAHPSDPYSTTEFKVEPSLEEPYAAGQLSDATIQNALNMINQCRYIAGLNADVANYPEMESRIEAAALVNALNGGLSHYPERPEELADSRYDDLYSLAQSGASSANLSAGRSNLAASILWGYMYDSDSSNIDRLGHRRWVLNPSMGKTAFGFCYRSGSYYRYYSGMYAFDRSGSGRQSPVAWPAQMMPLDRFYNSGTQAWSVSFGYEIDPNAVEVTVTRNSDGKAWHFSSDNADGYFNVNNDWYGQPGCVIFRLPTTEYCYGIDAGTSFRVTIRNSGDKTLLEYTVEFFNL